MNQKERYQGDNLGFAQKAQSTKKEVRVKFIGNFKTMTQRRLKAQIWAEIRYAMIGKVIKYKFYNTSSLNDVLVGTIPVGAQKGNGLFVFRHYKHKT